MTRREFLGAGAAAAALAVAGRVVPAWAATDEFALLDATAQADLVRRKRVKPIELVDAAIARIEKRNPEINAVILNLFDQAREKAKGTLPSGPFTGVPYLIKDLHPYKGAKLTFGCRFFRNNVARFSSEAVRRMEAAGFVVLGKTNTPEFGLLPITEPKLFGPTRNPWDTSRSPGGSSGGSAAAVASGMVPIADASDGGGSIRIPSSACGVFGMKVSRGRVSRAPLPNAEGLSVELCVSRSVRDSAALLDAIHGAVPGERWWAPPPPRPYLQEVGAKPGKLRIAFATADFTGNPVHPDCAAAVQSTAKLCAELGHRVEEAKPDLDGNAFNDAFILLWAMVPGKILNDVRRRLKGKLPADQFEPWTLQLADYQAKRTPADELAAWDVLEAASYRMGAFLERYDVLLTPVLGTPPVKTGEIDQAKSFEELRAQLTKYVAFTPVANVTGQPAMSAPLYWNKDGLPIGSHFFGRFGDESTLYRLAAQLEHARPWAERWPRIGVGG